MGLVCFYDWIIRIGIGLAYAKRSRSFFKKLLSNVQSHRFISFIYVQLFKRTAFDVVSKLVIGIESLRMMTDRFNEFDFVKRFR